MGRYWVRAVAVFAAVLVITGPAWASSGPPDQGDTGQFACSLISSSDVTHVYGWSGVVVAYNGGNVPQGTQPGYSDCLVTATGGYQITVTVAIYPTASAASAAYSQQSSVDVQSDGFAQANVGNGASYGAGGFILLQGRDYVDVGASDSQGNPPGSEQQALALAQLVDGHFAQPVAPPSPPKPGRGDLDPCVPLVTSLLHAGFGVKVTARPAFTEIPDTFQCDYEIGGYGPFYLNTATTSGLARAGSTQGITGLYGSLARQTGPDPKTLRFGATKLRVGLFGTVIELNRHQTSTRHASTHALLPLYLSAQEHAIVYGLFGTLSQKPGPHVWQRLQDYLRRLPRDKVLDYEYDRLRTVYEPGNKSDEARIARTMALMSLAAGSVFGLGSLYR